MKPSCTPLLTMMLAGALLRLGSAAAQIQTTPDTASPSGNPQAEEQGLFATVTLASEYTWRGISFSERKPSLQTSIDYTTALAPELNLEAGAWLYSSKYQERPAISIDTGVYAGLNGPAFGAWRWALRTMRSRYPQASDWNYSEHSVHLSLPVADTVGSLGLELAYAYSPRAFGTDSIGRYLEAELKLQLPQQLILSLHAGRSQFSMPELTYRNFNDFKVALGGQWQALDIEAGWIATSNSSQFGRMGRGRAVLSVSHTF